MIIPDKNTTEPLYIYYGSQHKYKSSADLDNPTLANRINYSSLHEINALTVYTDKNLLIEKSTRSTFTIDEDLPYYIYTIKLTEQDGIIQAHDPIPPPFKQRLIDIIALEIPDNTSNWRFLNLEYLTANDSFNRLVQHFGVDRGERIMTSIGINALHIPTQNVIRIFNKKDLPPYQRQRIFDADKFEKSISKYIANYKNSSEFVRHRLDIKNSPLSSISFISALDNDLDLANRLYKELQAFDKLKSIKTTMSRACLDQKIKDNINYISPKSFLSPEFNKASKQVTIPTTSKDLKHSSHSHHINSHAKNMSLNTFSLYKTEFVTKEFHNEESCKSEYEAYKIYEAFGVNVPQTSLITENKKTTKIALEYIKGPIMNDLINDVSFSIKDLQKLRREFAKDFPIDALIGNYDSGSIHFGNAMLSKSLDSLYRIDPGAALQFLHNGQKKPIGNDSREWGEHINDFYFLRVVDVRHDTRNAGIRNFSGQSNQDILNRLYQAEKDMPKVKKVASTKNYNVIEKRLNLAINHFQKICHLETGFQENKIDTTKNNHIKEIQVSKNKLTTALSHKIMK